MYSQFPFSFLLSFPGNLILKDWNPIYVTVTSFRGPLHPQNSPRGRNGVKAHCIGVYATKWEGHRDEVSQGHSHGDVWGQGF